MNVLSLVKHIFMPQQASMRRANLSHAQQSKIRADDRRREILREENVKRLAAEKLLEANMASEERVENKRFLCRRQLEQRERDMEQALFQVRKNIQFDLTCTLHTIQSSKYCNHSMTDNN